MTSIASVSVCMATHNGAPYVSQQLRSILAQIGEHDEVIVVDDASSDGTVEVVRSMGDPRIRLYRNSVNRGYVRTFERALSKATGDHVFLSDQDDDWPEGRVSTMQRALLCHAVVAGNVAIMDGPGELRSPIGRVGWMLHGDPSRHPWPWLLRLAASNAPYFGSAMAMRAELVDLALPFPASVRELHDAWLALLGLHLRSITHVSDRVVLRRIHGNNASGTRRSWPSVLRGRWYFALMWRDARQRTCQRSRLHRNTRPTP